MDLPKSLEREALRKSVHQALKSWHARSGKPVTLFESLLLVRERRADHGSDNPVARRLAMSEVLLEAIEELEQVNPQAGRLLRLRFPEDNTLLLVANKLNVGEFTVSRLQRAAIGELTEILLGRELVLREQKIQSAEMHFPPSTYSRLIGLDTSQATVIDLLLRPKTPWIIALVGIGGLGKTALADAVARSILREFHFEQVIWLRVEPYTMSGRSHSPELTFENLVADLAERLWDEADSFSPQRRMEQVRQALKSRRCLVIIDNLESESDTALLLAHLADLSDPTKFLLTSRSRLAAETAAYNHSLAELSREDALKLFAYQAEEIGLGDITRATSEVGEEVYELTGGNPLALKLVVSLLDALPLSQIRTDLAHSRPGAIDDMYRHIYLKTWQTLSDPARSLMLAMPLVARSGALPEQLQDVTSLPEEQFWIALQELRRRSLLEVRGTIQERRYGIHRLTETFLRTEIISQPHGSR